MEEEKAEKGRTIKLQSILLYAIDKILKFGAVALVQPLCVMKMGGGKN